MKRVQDGDYLTVYYNPPTKEPKAPKGYKWIGSGCGAVTYNGSVADGYACDVSFRKIKSAKKRVASKKRSVTRRRKSSKSRSRK